MTNHKKILDAASAIDWTQVRLNNGPPCFHVEIRRRAKSYVPDYVPEFCLRAERWAGHHGGAQQHGFVSLGLLLLNMEGPARNDLERLQPLIRGMQLFLDGFVKPAEQDGG